MKSAIFTALFLICAFSTVVPHVGPIESHAPLTYKVHLEDDPKTRWAPIIRDFIDPLTRFL